VHGSADTVTVATRDRDVPSKFSVKPPVTLKAVHAVHTHAFTTFTVTHNHVLLVDDRPDTDVITGGSYENDDAGPDCCTAVRTTNIKFAPAPSVVVQTPCVWSWNCDKNRILAL
jgi:hypothetical protein